MVGCDVLRNTSKDFAVVDGIAAMAENVGAFRDVVWAPWHLRHVASANCFPEAGWPTCWPKARAMLARRSSALHANERTGIIERSFRRKRQFQRVAYSPWKASSPGVPAANPIAMVLPRR